MACFWENLRRAVEVCIPGLGNYMYGQNVTPAPNFNMIEVAQDLSSYTSTLVTPDDYIGSLYSKHGKVYSVRYDSGSDPSVVCNIRRYDDGVMTLLSGTPTGLSIITQHGVYHAANKWRAINTLAGNLDSLYESNDGETWAQVSGSVTFPRAADFGKLIHYTMLGSRFIATKQDATSAIPMQYSDNGGATWIDTGAASLTSSAVNVFNPYAYSGGILTAYNSELYTSTDGASWTRIVGIRGDVSGSQAGVTLASSGTGLIVATGLLTSAPYTGSSGFAYSNNHGASWSFVSRTVAGVPTTGYTPFIFWDGEKFVGFFRKTLTPSAAWSIYVSLTGAAWAEVLAIPTPTSTVVQIID